MKKQDIINMFAEMLDITKVKATEVVEALFEAISKEMKKGGSVDIAGFGSFLAAPVKASVKRNPKTGASLNVPAHKKPKFRPAKALKELVY